jgi:hypothetical protein
MNRPLGGARDVDLHVALGFGTEPVVVIEGVGTEAGMA